jgi:undecaprenyl-diphosphatase
VYRSKQTRAGAAAVGAALAIGLTSAREAGRTIDRRVHRFLNRSHGPQADALLKSVTELGSLWASAAASAVLFRARRKRAATDAMGAAVATWLLGQGLKRLFARPRPYRELQDNRLMIAEPSGTSWPSNHPAVLLAFVTAAARDLEIGPAVRAALSALAGLVGLSRIYLGVHYPSDVVGGLLLGRGLGELWSVVVSPRLFAPSSHALDTVGA